MDNVDVGSERTGGDPEIENFVERIKLSEAPIIVYGKANPSIRWDDTPWNANIATLARLFLYCRNLATLYSDRGCFQPLQFETQCIRNFHDAEPSDDGSFFFSQIKILFVMDFDSWTRMETRIIERQARREC